MTSNTTAPGAAALRAAERPEIFQVRVADQPAFAVGASGELRVIGEQLVKQRRRARAGNRAGTRASYAAACVAKARDRPGVAADRAPAAVRRRAAGEGEENMVERIADRRGGGCLPRGGGVRRPGRARPLRCLRATVALKAGRGAEPPRAAEGRTAGSGWRSRARGDGVRQLA